MPGPHQQPVFLFCREKGLSQDREPKHLQKLFFFSFYLSFQSQTLRLVSYFSRTAHLCFPTRSVTMSQTEGILSVLCASVVWASVWHFILASPTLKIQINLFPRSSLETASKCWPCEWPRCSAGPQEASSTQQNEKGCLNAPRSMIPFRTPCILSGELWE